MYMIWFETIKQVICKYAILFAYVCRLYFQKHKNETKTVFIIWIYDRTIYFDAKYLLKLTMFVKF